MPSVPTPKPEPVNANLLDDAETTGDPPDPPEPPEVPPEPLPSPGLVLGAFVVVGERGADVVVVGSLVGSVVVGATVVVGVDAPVVVVVDATVVVVVDVPVLVVVMGATVVVVVDDVVVVGGTEAAALSRVSMLPLAVSAAPLRYESP
jgi:hypothetical protein